MEQCVRVEEVGVGMAVILENTMGGGVRDRGLGDSGKDTSGGIEATTEATIRFQRLRMED